MTFGYIRDKPEVGKRYQVEAESCDSCSGYEFTATYLGDNKWDNGVTCNAEWVKLTEVIPA